MIPNVSSGEREKQDLTEDTTLMVVVVFDVRSEK